MKTNVELFEELKSLGIDGDNWSIEPLSKGKITWLSSDKKPLAEADFKVILKVGPRAMYTMAYAIEEFKVKNIPYVEKVDDGPIYMENLAKDSIVWDRGREVGDKIGADFVFACQTLLVAVFNFKVF